MPLAGCTHRDELVIERASGEEELFPQSDETAAEHSELPEEAPEEEAVRQEIIVFVCGAVAEEGVYPLPAGSRMCDALEAAGGFSEDADTSWLNLASFIRDGQQIRVPTRAETASAREGLFAAGGTGQEEGIGRININTADAAQLQKIPGIGSVKAGRIIAYRKEHGAFRTPEELRKVSGIGEAAYQQMREYITVGDPQ